MSRRDPPRCSESSSRPCPRRHRLRRDRRAAPGRGLRRLADHGDGSTHGAGYRLAFLERMRARGRTTSTCSVEFHSGPEGMDGDHEGTPAPGVAKLDEVSFRAMRSDHPDARAAPDRHQRREGARPSSRTAFRIRFSVLLDRTLSESQHRASSSSTIPPSRYGKGKRDQVKVAVNKIVRGGGREAAGRRQAHPPDRLLPRCSTTATTSRHAAHERPGLRQDRRRVRATPCIEMLARATRFRRARRRPRRAPIRRRRRRGRRRRRRRRRAAPGVRGDLTSGQPSGRVRADEREGRGRRRDEDLGALGAALAVALVLAGQAGAVEKCKAVADKRSRRIHVDATGVGGPLAWAARRRGGQRVLRRSRVRARRQGEGLRAGGPREPRGEDPARHVHGLPRRRPAAVRRVDPGLTPGPRDVQVLGACTEVSSSPVVMTGLDLTITSTARRGSSPSRAASGSAPTTSPGTAFPTRAGASTPTPGASPGTPRARAA